MAAFGLTSDRTNILPAGITSWLVMAGKAGEIGAIELAPISDGTVSFETHSAVDSLRRPNPFAFMFKANCKVLGTDKAGFLQKLNLLTGYINTHQITGINGKTYTCTGGTYWKFVCDGSIDVHRYVEVSAELGLLTTSLDAMIGAGALAASNSADYLYGMAPGTIYPAGFSSISTRNSGETAWETFGTFRNPSLTAELKYIRDQNLSPIGYAVQVDVNFELLQSDEEILLLDSLATGKPDLKVTLMDGTILTFADCTGLNFTHTNGSDVDDIVYTKMAFSGAMTIAAFDTLIT